MRVSLVESPMLLPHFPILDLENFASEYRKVQPAEAPVGSVRADTRPSHGFWKPIPPHRSFLPKRWSECLPWCRVLLSVGSDQAEPRGSVQTVTRWSCWHWHQFPVPGVPGMHCWKDVSEEVLWPEGCQGALVGI